MRPYASLSLDLDNQWSYMKTHGDAGWQEYPSYLGVAVPRILDFLAARRTLISFFIVGQDAVLEGARQVLRPIAEAGHEIASHSFHHDPWLHLFSEEQIDAELERAEVAIEAATSVRPLGFRGPGFSLSPATLRVLLRRGYQYDCTVFPNALNPLARAYFFATSNLTKAEREQRKALFGTLADATRPIDPFLWSIGRESLLEIPVTTMPLLRIPIHLSYILYLSQFSRAAARVYLRIAIAMCRLTGTAPSILLHPLDFLGAEDAPALAFFPGMNLSAEHKIRLVSEVFDALERRYELVTMIEHARRARSEQPRLRVLELQAA
jgi:peptidoglycan/xylan/chitin deacetylase (PgdA/CDA1 family)